MINLLSEGFDVAIDHFLHISKFFKIQIDWENKSVSRGQFILLEVS